MADFILQYLTPRPKLPNFIKYSKPNKSSARSAPSTRSPDLDPPKLYNEQESHPVESRLPPCTTKRKAEGEHPDDNKRRRLLKRNSSGNLVDVHSWYPVSEKSSAPLKVRPSFVFNYQTSAEGKDYKSTHKGDSIDTETNNTANVEGAESTVPVSGTTVTASRTTIEPSSTHARAVGPNSITVCHTRIYAKNLPHRPEVKWAFSEKKPQTRSIMRREWSDAAAYQVTRTGPRALPLSSSSIRRAQDLEPAAASKGRTKPKRRPVEEGFRTPSSSAKKRVSVGTLGKSVRFA
ncbi:hypothetical protein K488DRAFT_86107 [Vararia minispora EC-137]|uniref:Uncharacterized protein n=1 Tax=Vararia minispora EC-137 TaxID=1314806 RepID=A0ACB8QKI6_9AGAM|nr:hypothetical protein K488DRAFT_86107 [Vararia minispora EC-137]